MKNNDCTVIMTTSSGLLMTFRDRSKSLTALAHFLPFADSIVVIDSTGQVKLSGTPNSVIASEWLSKNPLQQADSQTNSLKVTADLSRASDELCLNADPGHDTSRRTGDMKLYLFYARLVEWPYSLLYLCVCGLFVVGIYSSRECLLPPGEALPCSLFHPFSCLVATMGKYE